MAERESSVIEHLIEVETQASVVMQNAQDEATKKVNAAKAQAEEEYINKYSSKVKILEQQFIEDSQKIASNSKEELELYKKSIESTVQNKKDFNNFVSGIFQK